MNKTLALIALLGLVSAPAFASDPSHAEKAAAPAVKAEKVVAKDGKEEHKEEAKEGEAKKEEKK